MLEMCMCSCFAGVYLAGLEFDFSLVVVDWRREFCEQK